VKGFLRRERGEITFHKSSLITERSLQHTVLRHVFICIWSDIQGGEIPN